MFWVSRATALFFVLLSALPARADWAEDFNGCKIEVDGQSATEPGSRVAWTGSCLGGYAQGTGSVVYNYVAPNDESVCEGEMAHGRFVGPRQCIMNNGNTFSGILENGEIMGEATYTWKVENCPKCMRKYKGTFYKGQFAQGTAWLADGQQIAISFYPSEEGCLVWNKEPQPDERISWSGKCEGGLANGPGILTFTAAGRTEITEGTMAKGMLEGRGSAKVTLATPCERCVVGFDGTFAHGQPQKGELTMGDGRKVPFAPVGNERAEMEKLVSEALVFDLAMMKMKQQMAMSAAMADVANHVSCNIDPSCMMVETYEWVPTYP